MEVTALRYELSGDGQGLKKWFRRKDGEENFYHVHGDELNELEQWIHGSLVQSGALFDMLDEVWQQDGRGRGTDCGWCIYCDSIGIEHKPGCLIRRIGVARGHEISSDLAPFRA